MHNFKILILISSMMVSIFAADDFNPFVPKVKNNIAFDYIIDIAHDNAANIYVLHTGGYGSRNKLQKFDKNGRLLNGWSNDYFIGTTGIAVDSARGFMYVTQGSENRINKFDLSGKYIGSWGTSGDFDGQFDYPTSIAVDSAGNVYVVDYNNNRVQKFTNRGRFLLKWGGAGDAEGRFDEPTKIAIDNNNRIYIVDTENYRIQKFNAYGTFLTQWAFDGSPDLYDITTDIFNKVYVLYGNYYYSWRAIQKFDSSGNLLDTFANPNHTKDSAGNFDGYINIDSNINTGLYVAGSYGDKIRVQIMSFTKKEQVTSFGTYGTAKGDLYNPRDIAVDSKGNFYVVDTSNHRIQKFSSSGTYMGKWGKYGTGEGEFNSPTGITINSLDQLYVADYGNHRIQKFTSSGTFISKWGTQGSGINELDHPRQIAVDLNRNLYVTDYDNNRVVIYNENGAFLAKWDINSPFAIAVDTRNNNVFVTSLDKYEVVKFDPSGNILTRWGHYGYDVGEFKSPTGITVDERGNVFVADSSLNKIQKFTTTGEFKYRYDSDTVYPYGMSHNKLGDIYLAGNIYGGDGGIYRLQQYPDFDGDGVPNSEDEFPFDSGEWIDSDQDGIGNNRDLDDDNDGIPDVKERQYELDPLNPKDAQWDNDKDGFSNAVEIQLGFNPRSAKGHPKWAPVFIGNTITLLPARY